MNGRIQSLALSVGLAAVLISCTFPGVERLNQPQAETVDLEALLNSRQLSDQSRRFLSEQGLLGDYEASAVTVIVALHQRLLANSSSRQLRLSLIELCSDEGGIQQTSDPRLAVAYYLAAAELAYFEIRYAADPSDLGLTIIAAYNHSAGQVAKLLFPLAQSTQEPVSFDGPWRNYQLTSLTDGDTLIDLGQFDELDSVGYIKLKNTDVERVRRYGFGAAMVAFRAASLEDMRKNPFLSPLGMAIPVNVTLEFSADGGDVEMASHDLTLVDTTELGGRHVPLAADLTTPLVVPFNNFEERNIGWKGMLHPDAYSDYMKLVQLEAYRPEKIPLVMVHGLLSSPHVWLTLFNALTADPLLRKHYQLFVFIYPTGFPIGYSAASLRLRLTQFQEYFDPNRSNPNMRNIMLIGHSMGGVLSSMQIRSSTEPMLRTFFTMPIDELVEINDEQKAALKAMLIYQASPDVTRAVFVAAPHRGSGTASGLPGTIGSSLIDDPTETVLTGPLYEVDGLTDAGQYIVTHPLNGIESLVPYNPGLLAVLEQPIREGVTFHSIVGQRDPNVALAESTDGTVPYWSSHLDAAASEKVVYDKHSPMVKNDSTINELRRLLYLHANL